MTISTEQFALWSFQRDKKEGCYRGERNALGKRITTWDSLDPDEQLVYMEEAEHYIANVSQSDWPEDILVRLQS